MRQSRRNHTRQRGAALIELALIIPLLLLLTFTTTELGRAVYQYHVLVKAVRDGARYLSVQPPGTHITEARNLMVYGNLAGTGSPLVHNLGPDNVPAATCCTWQPTGTAPIFQSVTVRISGYRFLPLVTDVFGTALGDAEGGINYPTISATMRAPL
jgi:Flp pilus assembly protein TadG